MDSQKQQLHGRVRNASTDEQNKRIDQEMLGRLRQYNRASDSTISERLEELNKEWDIEKTLEVNASSLSLAGLALGTWVDKRWYILPGVVCTFLLQHGLQGWCPPLPLFRYFGVRTKQEIDEERTALKVMRGDFKELSDSPEPQEIFGAVRK